MRHTLTSLLLAAVAAALAGTRSFTAIGEWAADAPPRVLAALGIRYEPLARRFGPPYEATRVRFGPTSCKPTAETTHWNEWGGTVPRA